MNQSTTVLYRVPTPYSMGDAMIEVYGDPEMGWYEWRILEHGRITQDTGQEGTAFCPGRQYGIAVIALRDALIEASK